MLYCLLHGYAGRYFKQILAGEGPDFQRSFRKHTMIGFDAFKYGIIKRRVVEGHDESRAQWRLGHPTLFPNILWVGSTLQSRVPVLGDAGRHRQAAPRKARRE